MKTVDSKLLIILFCLLLFSLSCSSDNDFRDEIVSTQTPISMSTLLDEMISFESSCLYPNPNYKALQYSSYDRKSVDPDVVGWFSNNDGTGFVRYDKRDTGIEKVLFEQCGPGVITRIWMTGIVNDVNINFYIDGEDEPRLKIPTYDMSMLAFDLPEALSIKHEHYKEKGGVTFFLPIPYQSGCRITVDKPEIGYAFHINYRKYPEETKLKSFTLEELASLKFKLEEVNSKLLSPPTFLGGNAVEKTQILTSNETLSLDLPKGNNAIKTLNINVAKEEGINYSQIMRNLIVKLTFDGKLTTWVPLSDISGGGIGAPKVDSWLFTSDGNGKIILRWIMPYQEEAKIEIENISSSSVDLSVIAYVDDWIWSYNTLYFHASWKQERGLSLGNDYSSLNNEEWEFANLSGRGVYKADVLSLYNHTSSWYGEGDEKIWIDNEVFPSHFGTGTEDYYNTSFAPIHSFNTPFGGAPRCDNESSFGYNTFMRIRSLDAIPFSRNLNFYFELLGWNSGKVDYSSTVFWYGDIDAEAKNLSSYDEALFNVN